jgi:Na+-driven multidrug efflux pump
LSNAAAKPAGRSAIFLTGSIMRHVVVMTMTGAIGLMTMFGADLADLYYLSLLKDTNVTAAIGFAGILSFSNLSMSLGIGIAAAALVARNLGAGDAARAKEFATSAVTFTLVVSGIYTLVAAIFADPIMRFLGAEGEALRLATSYIRILTPGFIMLATAVCCSFALRGIGSPTRAMFVTLGSAAATLVLDPIMIFHFGLASRERPSPMSAPMPWRWPSACTGWVCITASSTGFRWPVCGGTSAPSGPSPFRPS